MHARATIGFGFTCDWLKKWRENFEPIAELSNAKPKQFANYFRHSIENRSKMLIIRIFLPSVTRIIRVIAQPRGNMLLIGIGGSGRQSLSRLSAYIIGFKVFQIEVTKHYRKIEFSEGVYSTRCLVQRTITKLIMSVSPMNQIPLKIQMKKT